MEMHDGNKFFEHKYPSIDVERMLDRFDSFEEFDRYYTNDLMGEDLLMGRYLGRLLDLHKLNPSRASRGIGKHESYVGKIVNGVELNPSRDVLIALCVLMGATLEETQILLRYSGKQPLYARRKRDAIVWFALKKRPFHQNDDGELYLNTLNHYLEDHNYNGLSKIIIKSERKNKEENENTIRGFPK